MKRLLFTILVFTIFQTAYSQNFFVPKYKIITENDDPVYLDMIKKKDSLNSKTLQVINDILYKNLESDAIANLFFNIKQGNTDYVSKIIQTDSIIKSVIARNNLSPVMLFKLTKQYKEIKEHENWYYKAISYKTLSKTRLKLTRELNKEYKKYGIVDGEKILEIGSGSLSFGNLIGSKRKNCDIYLNDISNEKLESMYLSLHFNKQLNKTNIQKRHNNYYIIQGSESSTGAENIIFDKIIIRNAFHCFSHKKEMLESIKKSMDENTILIIKDRILKKGASDEADYLLKVKETETKFKENFPFSEYQTDSTKKHYMYKREFEDIMKNNGFKKVYSKRIKNKSDKFSPTSWIYKFKKI